MVKQIERLLDYNENDAKTVVDGVAKFSVQSRCWFATHRDAPSVPFAQFKEQPVIG